MAINKVIYGATTLMDITNTTAIESDVASGKIFYTKDGEQALGTASGGGSTTIKTVSVINSSATATSLSFSVDAKPKMFALRAKPSSYFSISSSGSYYYIISMMSDGTHLYGNYVYRNSRIYQDTTHYSFSYSNGTLTVSSSGSRNAQGGSFYNTTYELFYIY